MITIDELLVKLKNISDDGYGNLPVNTVVIDTNYNITKYNIENVNVIIGRKKEGYVTLESR